MTLENYKDLPAEIPVIKEKELIYPFMIIPIFLEEKEDIIAIQKAINDHSLIFVSIKDEPGTYGTIGTIIRKVTLPEGKVKILFQGLARGKIIEITDKNPTIAIVDKVASEPGDKKEVSALLETLKEHIVTLSELNPFFPKDFIKIIDSNSDADRIVDIIASSLKLPIEKGYELFKEINTKERLIKLIHFILEEIESIKLKNELSRKVMEQVQEANREHLLKQQLKLIQQELGMTNELEEEIKEYREKLEQLKPCMREDAYKEIKKQIDRLSRMHPDSAEATTTQNYIEWALEVPFCNYAKEDFSIEELQKRLDKDHYGLKKPKERIVEYFAAKELAKKRNEEFSGATLCFVGPPGVGKTSLANSIAKALDRNLVRIALGGLEDVNELRGHRRTYIGAMPGRIAQGIINAKEMNPVMVLDEIDKISRYRGDPTAVLLEILDPEQNTHFRDLYLNFDLDLSKVLFIATANDPSTIPAPLRDRMEMIFIGSYTPQEKFEIAKRYLIPQEAKKHSLKKSEVSISDAALREIIDKYTKEAGVRNLRRIIAKIMRKAALEILEGKEKVKVTLKNLKDYLEKGYYGIEAVEKKDKVGVVNGLAWTPVGGDVLKVEAVKYRGKGQVILTGQLGDVMKESAHIAFTLIKVLIDNKKIKVKEKSKEPIYYKYNVHIHVPEGAIPKDGPSAGITMATAIASIFSETKVKSDVAMTGEITLTGEVLPIGGLKEKLIAAYKAKIKKVLIPVKNYERDLDDVPEEVKEGLEIVPVKTIDEVLDHALVK
ncbi:endopeptidase La [Caminibacter pacificus]|uniref:Lon protease n=1 Tax=Caminibacter pacificus TaxID=1424653 RepID=A0AAJ4RDT8_9BACT|nr:endopeptidase La [Caminibacter pacificus]NPA88358.1 endopeptidase La [Campylobacterota bacterium]QCI28505.1 endopeptidase La [Caminibacter pacificus]ROR40769.1 ATP-dependent proteinase [Caminibacter pacificus]